jgi:FtsP/CotA-like multicopper oxidase with cupredoxin domain
MSRNQRIGLVAVALVVAVVAFVIARPGGDDDDSDGSQQAAQTAPAQTETVPAEETAETQTETETEPPPPPEPEVSRIRVRGGTVVGGVQRVQAAKGDTVRILVISDAPDEIHLHGYDIYENAAPGNPARFVFRADIEGIFEIESHVAEDAGKDPLLARLVVEPS